MIDTMTSKSARKVLIHFRRTLFAEKANTFYRSIRSVIIERVFKDWSHNLSFSISEDSENPLKVINFIQAFRRTRFNPIFEVGSFIHSPWNLKVLWKSDDVIG